LVRQLYGSDQTADWGATKIIVSPRGGWQDVLTGRKMSGRGRIRASELLGDFPVSVLFGCSAK
jgi:maltooligosyltrehalose synthase